MIAEETMARYIDSRSQERKVRSFAQWSRASEVVFSKRRGAVRGVVRKICFLVVLGWLVSGDGVLFSLFSEEGEWYILLSC